MGNVPTLDLISNLFVVIRSPIGISTGIYPLSTYQLNNEICRSGHRRFSVDRVPVGGRRGEQTGTPLLFD